MNSNERQSRRGFVGAIAAGAAAAGLSMFPSTMNAETLSNLKDFQPDAQAGNDLDKALAAIGKKSHPVAYDISQAIPWGIIWSNVYYITNSGTGTAEDKLGVLNVLRHHGIIYALNDATIKKYNLGEFFGVIDPTTGASATINPYYEPADGVMPVPGLAGIKGLQEKGAMFCVCDMARQVYAQAVAKKEGAKTEDVYKDFVAGTLPGIAGAPSGVWVLGRLAENNIAYIDASVG